MDNMSISISTAYKKTLTVSQPPQKEQQPAVQSGELNNNSKMVNQSVEVELSDEAKEKSLQDSNQKALRKLMGKEDVEGTEGSDDKQTLDEMIAELQEEIAQLSQEMAQLRAKGDEQSESKAKSLEMQIASLTAQLMDLLTQKIEQEEKL
ncbi:MAG: hypothetical protein GY787_26975 [Alteromonadales bacterium]|nr:hypothetical protein [Alteromonadales bacterium]